MSIHYSSICFLDVLQENLSRVLTPWNYISVSPTPMRQLPSSSNSPQAQLTTPSSHSVVLAGQDQSLTPNFQDSDSEDILKTTPFEKRFGSFISPGWLPPFLGVSPVVRASSSQEAAISSPSAVSNSSVTDHSQKLATVPDHLTSQSSAPQQENGEYGRSDSTGYLTDTDADGEGEEEFTPKVNETNTFLGKLQFIRPDSPAALSSPHASVLRLQSPCKILSLSLPKTPTRVPGPSNATGETIRVSGEPLSASGVTNWRGFPRGNALSTRDVAQKKDLSNTPSRAQPSSPLSPLTPLTSSTSLTPSVSSGFPDSPDISFYRSTRTLARKRQLDAEAYVTSVVSRKKVRLLLKIPPRQKSDSIHTTATSSAIALPIYSTRAFPLSIEISLKFPLFYRRYPVSSYFQPQGFR